MAVVRGSEGEERERLGEVGRGEGVEEEFGEGAAADEERERKKREDLVDGVLREVADRWEGVGGGGGGGGGHLSRQREKES